MPLYILGFSCGKRWGEFSYMMEIQVYSLALHFEFQRAQEMTGWAGVGRPEWGTVNPGRLSLSLVSSLRVGW